MPSQLIPIAEREQGPQPSDPVATFSFAARKKFFGIRLAMSFQAALLPWIVGVAPWFSPAPVHAGVPLMFGVAVVGLRSESRPVHLAMAILMFALTLLSFLLVPTS